MQPKINLVLITLLAVVLLGGVSWAVQDRIKEQTKLEVSESLRAVLNASHQSLRAWVEEHKSSALLWGQSLEVRQATEDLLGAPQDPMSLIVSHAQPQVRWWLRQIWENYGYKEYSIVDANNINISASNNVDIGVKSLATVYPGFLRRIRMGETIVTLPRKLSAPWLHREEAQREDIPTMFVGAPIRNAAGQVIAALVLHLDPAQEFATILQRGWFRSSGETFAFDNQGRLLSNSRFDEQLRGYGLVSAGQRGMLNIDIREHGSNRNAGRESPLPDDENPLEIQELPKNLMQGEKPRPGYARFPLTRMAKLAIAGQPGVSLEPYRSYRGNMVVGAWLWDPELGFGLATELDASEAYKTLDTARHLIFILNLLIASLLVGLVTVTFANLKRKQAEAKAHKSEQRLEQFFYAAFEKIFFLIGSKIGDANPAALAVLGYSLEQIQGRDLLDIIAPSYHQGVASFMEVPHGESFEAQVITRDGERIPVEIRIKALLHDRGPLKVVGMRDISQRLRAEAALSKAKEDLEVRVLERTGDLQQANVKLEKEIEERKQVEGQLRKLSMAVEQSPTSIVITDTEGRIEYVNPRFTEATGYTFQEAVGQNPRILKSGRQSSAFYRELWETITAGKEWRGEFLNKKKNGELFWENASISPLVNETGEAMSFIAVKEDITKRKQADQQLRDLLEQNRTLTQRLFETQEKERQHLAQELHDEFGQWLTAIQLHSQHISDVSSDNDALPIRKSAKIINQSAVQMNKAVRNIIRELRPESLDDLGLAESLRELVTQWQIHHPDIAYELKNQCELDKLGEEVEITLYRIVQESLTNAAKYAQASCISVQLICSKPDKAMSTTMSLSIEDNGVGMDPEVPTKGMGLAGMRERIRSVGGQLVVNSQLGKGVQIQVDLPISLGE